MKQLKIAALVTAKGRNTLDHKHLLNVLGKPLVWYPINAVVKCKIIDRLYISSDDEEILKIGKSEGLRVIKQPDEISKPNSLHIDAIKYALKWMEEKDDFSPDILIVVLGNNVCFKTIWIEESIHILEREKQTSSVVPVYKQNDHHPYRAKRIDENGLLQTYFDWDDKKISTNRQDLPDNYFLCHNFWTMRVKKSLLKNDGQPPWSFMGRNIRPIVVDAGQDVHSVEDIPLCETWLENNGF